MAKLKCELGHPFSEAGCAECWKARLEYVQADARLWKDEAHRVDGMLFAAQDELRRERAIADFWEAEAVRWAADADIDTTDRGMCGCGVIDPCHLCGSYLPVLDGGDEHAHKADCGVVRLWEFWEGAGPSVDRNYLPSIVWWHAQRRER